MQTWTQTCIYAPQFGGRSNLLAPTLGISQQNVTQKKIQTHGIEFTLGDEEIREDPLMAVHLGYRSWPSGPWISAFLLFSLHRIMMS